MAELAGVDEEASRTGEAKIDETPDAAKMNLCYKVEAIDGSKKLIRTYQPMCVPQFNSKKLRLLRTQPGGRHIVCFWALWAACGTQCRC
jgi:hypothetical protein